MGRLFLMWMNSAHKQLKHKLVTNERKASKRLKKAKKKAIAHRVETIDLDKVVRAENIHLSGCTKKEKAIVVADSTSCALFVDPVEHEGTTMSKVHVGRDTEMSALSVIEPISKDMVGISVSVSHSRGKKRAHAEKFKVGAKGQMVLKPRVKATDENEHVRSSKRANEMGEESSPVKEAPLHWVQVDNREVKATDENEHVYSPKRAKEMGEESSPDKEAPLNWVQVDNRDFDQGLALMGSVAERSAVATEMSLSDALAIVGLCCGQVLATNAFIGDQYLKAREYAEVAEKEVKDAEHTLVKVQATMDEQLMENKRIDGKIAELLAQLDEEKHARYKVENALNLLEDTQKASETARVCAEKALKAAKENVKRLEKKANEMDNAIIRREQELTGILEKTMHATKEKALYANKSSPIFQVDRDEMLLPYLDGAQRHIVRCVKQAYPDIPLQTLVEWMRKDQFSYDLRELHSMIPYSAEELIVLAKEDVEWKRAVWTPPSVQEDNVVVLAKRSYVMP